MGEIRLPAHAVACLSAANKHPPTLQQKATEKPPRLNYYGTTFRPAHLPLAITRLSAAQAVKNEESRPDFVKDGLTRIHAPLRKRFGHFLIGCKVACVGFLDAPQRFLDLPSLLRQVVSDRLFRMKV